MNNKSIIKGVVMSATIANMPVDSLANTIEGYGIENVESKIKENNREEIGIKKFFAKIVEPIEDLISNPKEVIKVNRNIIEGKVLEITLNEGDFVQNLSGNPDGYETVRVTTIGDKKLVKADYDKLRLSGIPKVDLSNAYSDFIPAGAFTNATHLTEFIFPQGVTYIEDGEYTYLDYTGAFSNCPNLSGNLIIPDTITSIGDYAFNGCSGFNGSLVIPNSVTSIGQWAFKGCGGFTGNLVIPESVTNIDAQAFYGCTGFNGNLTISDGVTSIGRYAFRGCSGLTGDLIIPGSVASIGSYAFYECTGFNGNLTISEGVMSIGEYAFYSCSGFIGDLIIPDSITTIGSRAFQSCSGFTGDLTIPGSVASIDNSVFYGCTGFDGNLTISEGVTSIGSYAFYGCTGFDGDLIIPGSVSSIGNSAFYGCTGFDSNLTISDGVTSIGDSTFYGCSGFTGDLIIPGSVSSISSKAFYKCTGFNGNLTISDGVTSIGERAFEKCEGFNGSLVISNSLTSIGRYAFYECSGFTGDLIIPSSLTSIGDSAFHGCTGFNGSLTISDGVTSIGASAFSSCSGFIGDLIIPNSVISIGDSAFRYCSGFTGDLMIPNSVTSVGSYSFNGCRGFNGSLVIPNSVTSIGDSAFYSCTGLSGDLIIPNSVTSIGNTAFGYCSGLDKIIAKIDESDIDTNYRKAIIEKLPIDKTYIEMSYNLDITGTWLEKTNYIKAKPIISAYAGYFENNEGMGVTLDIVEASDIKIINTTKDSLDYIIEKNENGKYLFNEHGEYNIYIETELGTISNISFRNTNPILEPNLEFNDNIINIVNNGILANAFVEKLSEEFDNPDDLELSSSNPGWTIEDGRLKSEYISHSSSTENELVVNAENGDKLQINVKTSSEGNYDWGYIYLNGVEVYKKSGTTTDFETIELDLQEGENTVKFKYTKDSSGSKGNDAMFIDYIKVVGSEIVTKDCDTLEYRVNGGEWQIYTDAFELNYPVGTKVLVEVRARHDGFTSTILSQEVTIELNIQVIEDAIEKAEQSKDVIDISDARDLVNSMPESSKKDEFQDRLDAISPNLTLDRETVTANLDIYIKSENMLSLSLDTNSVSFEEYSGAEPMEKLNAVNITINSSLPYDLNAYMPNEIMSSDENNRINMDILNVRESSESVYKQFEDTTNKLILKENCQKGNDINHSIDLKLDSSDAHVADIYKTVIKFEAEQK